jgi:hypothetical protein
MTMIRLPTYLMKFVPPFSLHLAAEGVHNRSASLPSGQDPPEGSGLRPGLSPSFYSSFFYSIIILILFRFPNTQACQVDL